jgi:hypothetical protein
LNTLREIIIYDSRCLEAYITNLTNLLLDHTQHPEESIRTIVAESIGRLFQTYPVELVDSITNGLTNGKELVKETLAKSVKYSINKDVEE